jgi:acetylornithine deacetylase/succinyl-diaminopimelate desuccinylase-like protein
VTFPLLDWAERFIATPSVSRDGNLEIAERAVELLASIGLAARVDDAELDGVRHRNVIADLGPEPGSTEGVLLVTHLDTVPPGERAAWTATDGDPFRPTRDGDRLYGLGSADAKVDLVCKVAALAELDRAELRRPVRVVGTFGEEVGLRGARRLVESGGARGFRYALIGEPSELVCIYAHKAYAVFEAHLPVIEERVRGSWESIERFEGEAAHSSTPHLGKNAIEAALLRIAELDNAAIADLEGGGIVNQVPDRCRLSIGSGYPQEPLFEFLRAWRRLCSDLGLRRDSEFDPDHSVANLGRVEFRESRPVFTFDLRPVPGVDPLEAVRPLEECAMVERLRLNPPLETARDADLVRAVVSAQESAGLGERVGTKATSTEAGIFSAAGLESVVIGAGVSAGNIHRPNEHTLISQLEAMRDLYRETLRRLALEAGA